MKIIKAIYIIVLSLLRFRRYELPDIYLESILLIDENIIEKYKISKIIFDIDQTILPHRGMSLSDDIIKYLKKLSEKLGQGNICFLTNEPNFDRENYIKHVTGINVISGKFGKPDWLSYMKALQFLNTKPGKHVAMVGDRVWTDIIGANYLGILTIEICPFAPHSDPLLIYLVRKAEKIFQCLIK